MAKPDPIPVTVIGGYLGAGKTTLVNHLLRQAEGLRLAVLVNEFGELPIDGDLIERQDETMIEIAGGCVCCSYGSDLMAALMDLQQLQPAPDHILIEASGVALPDAIAQSVTLLARYRVDGILVLADSETVRAHGTDRYLGDTIARQLAVADIVLLNKTDLATADVLAETRRWLETMSGDVRIVETEKATVPLPVVLGAGLEHLPSAEHDHSEAHATHQAAVLEVGDPVDPEALARALSDPQHDLVRAKGFVTGLDGAVYAIQTVGRRWSATIAEKQPETVGRIVCIRCNGDPDLAALTGLCGAQASA